MKYFLVFAVVWVAYWIWRKNRLADKAQTTKPVSSKPPVLRQPTVMVACLYCGTHLPENDAVQGSQGTYCSTEHRQLGEGSGP